MSPIAFNLDGESLIKGVLTEVGDFNIEGRIFNRVKFANDAPILAKTQEELQHIVKSNCHWKE